MYSGEILRRLRLIKGIKQKVVAQMLGISQQAYSKVEKQLKVDSERFKTIVLALGSSPKEIEVAREDQVPASIGRSMYSPQTRDEKIKSVYDDTL